MNCYECKHRGDIPGDCHSKYHHPLAKIGDSPELELLAMLASARKMAMPLNPAQLLLGITLDPHGVKNGWANWPFNFDPVWVEKCDGFEPVSKLMEEKPCQK